MKIKNLILELGNGIPFFYNIINYFLQSNWHENNIVLLFSFLFHITKSKNFILRPTQNVIKKSLIITIEYKH